MQISLLVFYINHNIKNVKQQEILQSSALANRRDKMIFKLFDMAQDWLVSRFVQAWLKVNQYTLLALVSIMLTIAGLSWLSYTITDWGNK